MVGEHPMLAVDGVWLRVGRFALQEVSFRVERGRYFILLGPTGCGKTLLADTLCGLNLPQRGSIRIAGRDVTHADPALRRIGYVPQDHALLPFKTVEQNIAFGLHARRRPGGEVRERVQEVLDLLGIAHLRQRLPARLSGGERQRVALGRALAIRPDLLVLDEPLSALDEGACADLMAQLQRLQRDLGITFVHVCHRLEEALTLGDTLALMREGRIEQMGPPGQLMARPRNLFVARFLRLPNLVKGEVRSTSQGTGFFIGDHWISPVDREPGPAYGLIPLGETSLSLSRPAPAADRLVLAERIAENRAEVIRPGLRLDGHLRVTVPGFFSPETWQEGRTVYLDLPRAGVHLLDAEGCECEPEGGASRGGC